MNGFNINPDQPVLFRNPHGASQQPHDWRLNRFSNLMSIGFQLYGTWACQILPYKNHEFLLNTNQTPETWWEVDKGIPFLNSVGKHLTDLDPICLNCLNIKCSDIKPEHFKCPFNFPIKNKKCSEFKNNNHIPSQSGSCFEFITDKD